MKKYLLSLVLVSVLAIPLFGKAAITTTTTSVTPQPRTPLTLTAPNNGEKWQIGNKKGKIDKHSRHYKEKYKE